MAVIPKDQIPVYERWQAGSFDPPRPKAPVEGAVRRVDQGEQVTGIALPTAEEIEGIHNEAQQSGYQAGFDAGQQAGYEEGLASAKQDAERMAALLENFSQALAALDQQTADALLELALEVARKVVRTTLSIQPESIIAVVREAIAALPLHHGAITLHLNPADARLIHQQLGNQVAQSAWHIVEDPAMEIGGCVLRAGTSEVDAALPTRWRRVLESIGAQATADDAAS